MKIAVPAENVPIITIRFSRLTISLKEGVAYPIFNFVVNTDAIIDPSSPTVSIREGYTTRIYGNFSI